MTPRALLLTAFASLSIATTAIAQAPPVQRVRGTVESIDGQVMNVKARDGSAVKINLAEKLTVSGIVKISIADIKAGSYVGVAAMPEANGDQSALSVLLFPESMRGTGEGFRPWDLRPNSSMTNATVDNVVSAKDGQTLKVKYKDGEKTIVVTPETPVVTYVPGDKSELKPGAKIIAFAVKKDDGSFDAARVTVGRDGLTPPM